MMTKHLFNRAKACAGHAVKTAAVSSCVRSASVELNCYDGIFQKHVFQSLSSGFDRGSRRRGIGVEKQVRLPTHVEKRKAKVGAGNA
jgi:hypothetical protein